MISAIGILSARVLTRSQTRGQDRETGVATGQARSCADWDLAGRDGDGNHIHPIVHDGHDGHGANSEARCSKLPSHGEFDTLGSKACRGPARSRLLRLRGDEVVGKSWGRNTKGFNVC